MTTASWGERSSAQLSGKVAVVTGGGHGLGRAYARRLAEDGASVVVADIDRPAAKAVAAELSAQGLSALGTRVDVGEEASVRGMADEALAAFSRVDVLVNNAAIFRTVPLAQSSLEDGRAEDFERVLRVNVIGVWLCCQAVVKDMKSRGYGKIVNISSTRALRSPAGRSASTHYTASKAAVLGLTRALARELGESGIRVNSLAPGSTLSSDTLSAESITKAAGEAQSTERAIAVPQTARDLVGAVSFLCSPDSDFITGQTLVVDGGGLMY